MLGGSTGPTLQGEKSTGRAVLEAALHPMPEDGVPRHRKVLGNEIPAVIGKNDAAFNPKQYRDGTVLCHEQGATPGAWRSPRPEDGRKIQVI